MLKWGTPALSSTGQSQTYDPGSTYWVTLDVSPGTAAPGPPNRVNHVGRGADVRIAAAYAFTTSAAVRQASSRTIWTEWTAPPFIAKRKVVHPVARVSRAPDVCPLIVTA